MKIAEIFYSIQGEGALIGIPSVFIRTSGCNLRCTWCDTPYTSWSAEGENLSIEQIANSVAAFHAHHVVITGGEPMIARDIVGLSQTLHDAKFHITIETAGTVHAPVACDLMSISPKLSNSVPHDREGGRWAAQHERLRYQPEVLERLIHDYTYQLKFVVTSPGDLDEINQIRDNLAVEQERIILMPEGASREVLQDRGLWLAEICKASGYRYGLRLHIDLWGNRRGI